MSKSLDQSQLTARLEQTRPLRDLAHTWYELSLACRRVGAMIEKVAKEILYAPSNSERATNDTN